MTPNEYLESKIEELSKKFPPEIVFLEIGTSKGTSGIRFLTGINKSGVKRWFFSIDPYGNKPYRVTGEVRTQTNYGEEWYRKTMVMLNNYALENELLYCHWRILDTDFMEFFPKMEFWYGGKRIKDIQYGFIYLDGEHITESVLNEFRWFYERMPAGGMIVIDDINFLGMEEGVKELLKDFEGEMEFRHQEENHRVYFTKK